MSIVKPFTAIILAAGLGTRMKSARPKVLHEIGYKPLVGHALDTAMDAGAAKVTGVIGEGMDPVAAALAPHPTEVQVDRLGTAHAVLAAENALAALASDGHDLMVMFGDTPLLKSETLLAMTTAKAEGDNVGVVVLGFEPDDPGAYGRLILGVDGGLEKIVEAKEATSEELAVRLCNSGVMLIDGDHAKGWLEAIGNDNAKEEYYLTDIVAIARGAGKRVDVVSGNPDEVLGVNSRVELAEAERILQHRLRQKALEEGVTMMDPSSVYLAADTSFGRDVVVGPNVVFGPGVHVGDEVEIRSFCHLEGASIGAGARIGPFARLRPGAILSDHVHVGNFVEIKNATLGPGAKANHLSYIGDADVGERANIGAGTITCNYDGFFKSKTTIGAGAFIGSNTALVAPVTVGAGAIVGAGSTISRAVPDDDLSVTRADQRTLKGWALRFREKRRAEKAATQKDK